MLYEPELDAAIRAYYRHWRRAGQPDSLIDQPSRSSDTHADRVVLSNCRGYLATYDLTTRKIRIDEDDRLLVEGEA